MKHLCALFYLATLAVTSLAAAEGVPTLVGPQAAQAPGSTVEVFVVLLNPGRTQLDYPEEQTLQATFRAGEQTWPATLTAAGLRPSSVDPGAFAGRRYTVAIPDDAQGQLVLEVSSRDWPAIRAVVEAAQPAVADSSDVGTIDQGSPLAAAAVPQAAIESLPRTFASRLSPHEPIYFIYGNEYPTAKFQFSFKYKLMTFGDGGERWLPPTAQFAYTQRSLWDIGAESSPFYDTSYMPEFMIEMLGPREQGSSWFTWLGANIGYRHESNGQDGPASRSLNTFVAGGGFALGDLEGWHVVVAPEVHAYAFGLEDNPDLRLYRGYGRLRLSVGRADGPSLTVTGIVGEGWENYTMQYDLYVPVRLSFVDFETYLMAQYFDGYGESLRNYDERSRRIRAGIAFVR